MQQYWLWKMESIQYFFLKRTFGMIICKALLAFWNLKNTFYIWLQFTADKTKLNMSIEKTKCPLGISLVDLVKDSITVLETCKFWTLACKEIMLHCFSFLKFVLCVLKSKLQSISLGKVFVSIQAHFYLVWMYLLSG